MTLKKQAVRAIQAGVFAPLVASGLVSADNDLGPMACYLVAGSLGLAAAKCQGYLRRGTSTAPQYHREARAVTMGAAMGLFAVAGFAAATGRASIMPTHVAFAPPSLLTLAALWAGGLEEKTNAVEVVMSFVASTLPFAHHLSVGITEGPSDVTQAWRQFLGQPVGLVCLAVVVGAGLTLSVSPVFVADQDAATAIMAAGVVGMVLNNGQTTRSQATS